MLTDEKKFINKCKLYSKCIHFSFDQNTDSSERFRVGSISNRFDLEAPPFMIVDIPTGQDPYFPYLIIRIL